MFKRAEKPYDIIALLISLSAFVLAFQYITISKLIILQQNTRFTLFDFIKVVQHIITITPIDFVLGGGILLLTTSLIVLEVWQKRCTAFLTYIFENNTRTCITLILFCAISTRFYLSQGAFGWQTDMASHLSYCHMVSQAFQRGEFPIWTNLLGTGSPFLQFYGFLFFYLVGLTDQLVGNITLSIKLTLFILHIASGLSMYAFVNQLSQSRQAGFLAGLAYVLCFWHTQQVLILGRIHLSAFYALLPLPFYFFERLSQNNVRAIIGGGLTLGLLPFVHPAYGFWATLLLGLYVSLRIYTAPSEGKKPTIIGTLSLFALGLVFGAYLTVPMYLERAFAGLESGVSYDIVALPSWQSLFIWSNYQILLLNLSNPNWYGGYFGLSLILLALSGFVQAIRLKTRILWPICLCLIFTLILVFGYNAPIIRDIFIFQILAAGRYLLFVTFFFSALAGATIVLMHRLQNNTFYATILLVLFIDLGTTTFIHPYIPVETEKRLTHFSPTLYQSLKTETAAYDKNHLPPYRYLYLSDKQMMFLPNAWIPTQIGLPSCFNAYLEDPPATHIYNLPVSNAIQDMLLTTSNQKSEHRAENLNLLLSGLYSLNVRHIFTYQNEKLSHFTSNVTPIIASSHIIGWNNWKEPLPAQPNSTDEALTMLRHMQIDVPSGTSKHIFIKGYWPREEHGQTPQIDVQTHTVAHQRIDLTVTASTDCFVRLAYAYYPYLHIRINGQETTPYETADRFIALKLAQGKNHITIEAYQSPLRRTLMYLNLSILCVCAILLYRHRT